MEFKSFSQYLSEAKGEVYFVFGRFNPPTPGHDKLFDVLKKTAGSNPYRVYASKSQDAKKNPLSFKDKIKFMRKMFPKHARSIMADADVRTALDICVKLYKQGFTSVTMVAGSDRLQEFQVLLNKYNGPSCIKCASGFEIV
jgi:nicotinic acid mononucleotide adenylyltransferase